MGPNWAVQIFVGLTSVEAALVGRVSTRRTSARRTLARWSSPESGSCHLKSTYQKVDESRFVKQHERGENDGSAAATRGQRADDCPHANRSSMARGFCPSRDPGQSFDLCWDCELFISRFFICLGLCIGNSIFSLPKLWN